MEALKERRRKYFTDAKVQGAILRQAVFYWLLGSMTFAIIVFVFRVIPQCLSGQSLEWRSVWHHLSPMVVSSVVLLPVVIFSALRFTHRFVGPMVPFRRTLRQLAQGEAAPLIRLRRNDYWSDIAEEINRVSERICDMSTQLESSRDRQEVDELEEEPSYV